MAALSARCKASVRYPRKCVRVCERACVRVCGRGYRTGEQDGLLFCYQNKPEAWSWRWQPPKATKEAAPHAPKREHAARETRQGLECQFGKKLSDDPAPSLDRVAVATIAIATAATIAIATAATNTATAWPTGAALTAPPHRMFLSGKTADTRNHWRQFPLVRPHYTALSRTIG